MARGGERPTAESLHARASAASLGLFSPSRVGLRHAAERDGIEAARISRGPPFQLEIGRLHRVGFSTPVRAVARAGPRRGAIHRGPARRFHHGNPPGSRSQCGARSDRSPPRAPSLGSSLHRTCSADVTSLWGEHVNIHAPSGACSNLSPVAVVFDLRKQGLRTRYRRRAGTTVA